LRLLAAFEHIDAGRVTLGGRDVTNLPLRKRNIGFVFHGYALFPHLNVAQNIAFPLDVRKSDRSLTRDRVRELLELAQLPGREKRFPHELSGVNARWAILNGLLLCNARALGEFGAVSVISGNIRGLTDTVPLHIDILYNEDNLVGAFTLAGALALLVIVLTLVRSIIEAYAEPNTNVETRR
jgi:ABC-type molybdate transport system permease subunit